MKFLKRNCKTLIIFALIFIIVTLVSFIDFSEDKTTTSVNEKKIEFNEKAEVAVTDDILPDSIPQPEENQPEEKVEISDVAESDEIVSEDNVTKSDKLICTLSIRCDTILNNLNKLKPEKAGIIPPSGIILAETEVEFFEDENIFNVLLRETKKNKIHFEFSKTPVYNSVYIEGIANIYEFDCGDLSGWLYKVNSQTLPHSCSEYKLKPGDKIEFIYTCDLGNDIN
ncbi:MAG: DUF4430 domain-containing protein [Clostridia bacterium]|nr:DUF4430 domain-containing protein [Clostridia bacterium]